MDAFGPYRGEHCRRRKRWGGETHATGDVARVWLVEMAIVASEGNVEEEPGQHPSHS